MKKIVDVNFFADPELELFFRKSEKNIAVITSISAAEAYRRGKPEDVLDLFKIFSKFPKQVIFLKHTNKVILLKPISKNMQRRMVDEEQTLRFRKFANNFSLFRKRPKTFSPVLSELLIEANILMEKTAQDMDGLAKALDGFSKSFTLQQLGIIRRGEQYNPELGFRIIKDVFSLAKNLYERENKWKYLLDDSNIRNTYQFSFALCSYLLAVRWLSEGKTHAGKLEKVRNDMIDMTYTAFALHLDGLLSKDRKMNEIYGQARYIMDVVLDY